MDFQKEPYSAFGNPFLLKVKEGENFDGVKERIQAYLVSKTVLLKDRFISSELLEQHLLLLPSEESIC